MNVKQCLVLLLLFNLSTMILACPKGFFRINNPNNPCSVCFFGQYCPGDDNSYNCPKGTIAPYEGMSACVNCSSNRSNSDATVCLLPDTPLDAQEPQSYSDDTDWDLYKININQPFWYNTILTSDLSSDRSLPIQYSFIATNRKYDLPLTIFASVKTGKPDKGNYQWMATGQNATLIIPIDWIDPKTDFIVIYFSIIPPVDYIIPFTGRIFKRFAGEFSLRPNVFGSKVFENFDYNENQAVIEWNDIPSMAKVNISVTLYDMTHQRDGNYNLCYSKLSTILYPNLFNSNQVLSGNVNKQINLVLENVSGGKLRVGVVGGQINLVKIFARLEILN